MNRHSINAHSAAPPAISVAERVLNIRKFGSGHQYQIKWQGHAETTWEPASRVRKDILALVQAFEAEQQQQQQQQQHPSTDNADADAGARAEGAAMLGNEQPAEEAAFAADGSSMRAQMEAMQRLLREQAQQLQSLRALPGHSPQQAPLQAPPGLEAGAAAASAVAAAAAGVALQSRFARKEPRAQDLCEYDGASGAKLDAWLDELSLARMLYELNAREALRFAVSRLRGAALQWWLALGGAAQDAVSSPEALASALRARFQPVTAARTAREQLDKLTQGARSANDYIAEFQRLRTQLPSMAEDDALYAFERGLRRDLAVELRKQGVSTVQEAIALVARIGGLLIAPQGRSVAANQMDVDDDNDSAGRLDRIEAALNALSSGAQGSGGAGMGAKSQTQRGYQQERGSAGGRGGSRGSRVGRFGGRGGAGASFTIPGVPAAIVEQRRAAGQCFRCGSGDHRSMECPSAPTASQSSF